MFSTRATQAVAVIVVLLMALILSYGTLKAANESLPGDALYGVKRVQEQVKLTLARSPEEREGLRKQYTGERIKELYSLTRSRREARVDVEGPVQQVEADVVTVGDMQLKIHPSAVNDVARVKPGDHVTAIVETHADGTAEVTRLIVETAPPTAYPHEVATVIHLPTSTPTVSPTMTPHPTAPAIPTATSTRTASPTAHNTATPQPTNTPLPTNTPTPKTIEEFTPTAGATNEPTSTINPTATPQAAATTNATSIPQATGTANATLAPQASSTANSTATPQATVTANSTLAPQATSTVNFALTPQATNTTNPTATLQPTSTGNPTVAPSATSSVKPTPSLEPSATPTPTRGPPQLTSTTTPEPIHTPRALQLLHAISHH